MHKIVVVGAVGVLAFGLATGSFFAGALLAPLGARTPATGPRIAIFPGSSLAPSPISASSTTARKIANSLRRPNWFPNSTPSFTKPLSAHGCG